MRRAFLGNRKAGIFSCAGIALAAGMALAIAAPRVSRAQMQQAPATAPPGAPPPAGAPSSAGSPAAEAAAAAPTAPVAKTAGDAFMNVTVLRDAPADQLISAMEFMAASLGVQCNFCHVVPHFEDDSKRPKATARKMIQMELDIDKTNFNGRLEVTCYSCHRGAAHPVGSPVIPEEGQMTMAPAAPSMAPPPPGGPAMNGAPGAPPAGAAVAAQPAGPTVDQIIDKYTQAIGGLDAVAKITSRKADGAGTFQEAGGAPEDVTVDILNEAPDKRLLTLVGSGGTITQGTDGTEFWTDMMGHVNDVEGVELAELKRAADMSWLLDLRKNFTQFQLIGTQLLGDRHAYIVMAVPATGGPRERLLFDTDSGLLIRYAYTVASPVGNNPVEGDFSDYRDAGGGLKLPFTVRAATPTTVFTVHLTQVQFNVPVDDNLFAKPVATAMPAAAPAPTQ